MNNSAIEMPQVQNVNVEVSELLHSIESDNITAIITTEPENLISARNNHPGKVKSSSPRY